MHGSLLTTLRSSSNRRRLSSKRAWRCAGSKPISGDDVLSGRGPSIGAPGSRRPTGERRPKLSSWRPWVSNQSVRPPSASRRATTSPVATTATYRASLLLRSPTTTRWSVLPPSAMRPSTDGLFDDRSHTELHGGVAGCHQEPATQQNQANKRPERSRHRA